MQRQQSSGPYCVVYSKGRLAYDHSTSPYSSYPANLKQGGDIEQGRPNSLKTSRQRLRWNLIFNLLLFIIVPLPFWLPYCFETKLYSIWALVSIQGLFQIFWIGVSLLAFKTLHKLVKQKETDFVAKMKNKNLDWSAVSHLVVISCYKEPLDLIISTLDTIARQTLASEITMVVSFEERTPDKVSKQSKLCDSFGTSFKDFLFTIHPHGMEGEIAGKCSNANCGIRTALGHMKRQIIDLNPDDIIITTCDADSKFHPQYIEALTYKFLQAKMKKQANISVFQAPLFYNWNLDEASFFTRVTGLLRAFLMMGALIPMNINTMSIFSFTASLCVSGDFIHPAYQMDDIITLIRWMGMAQQRLKIVLVPVPLISGPTSGRVVEEELVEWARQARRWTIGAAEVFHYFAIKSPKIPPLVAVIWGIVFILYYGVILCCSALYSVALTLSLSLVHDKDTPEYIDIYLWASVALQYLIFLAIFLMDQVNTRLTQPKTIEHISWLRNLFHLLMAPLVLLVYSMVEFYALTEVMIKGKDVCKHGASKKEQLR